MVWAPVLNNSGTVSSQGGAGSTSTYCSVGGSGGGEIIYNSSLSYQTGTSIVSGSAGNRGSNGRKAGGGTAGNIENCYNVSSSWGGTNILSGGAGDNGPAGSSHSVTTSTSGCDAGENNSGMVVDIYTANGSLYSTAPAIVWFGLGSFTNGVNCWANVNSNIIPLGTFNSTTSVLPENFSFTQSVNSTNVSVTCGNSTNYTSAPITLSTPIPSTPPTWSGNSSSIPSTYSPITLSQFNITWSTGSSISTVLLESNYSGTPVNYTMAGSPYSYSAILPAGSFYWKSYGNDTWGNSNSTPSWNFTIAQANPNLNLTLNGSNSNITYTYGPAYTLWANTTVASGAPLVTLNGTIITSNYPAILGVGYYNFTASISTSQNYTSSSSTYFATVDQATGSPILTLNGFASNITAYYSSYVPATVIVSCTDASNTNHTLYQNGSVLNSTNGTAISYISTYNSSGIYNITCGSLAQQNYTAGQTSLTLNVSQALYEPWLHQSSTAVISMFFEPKYVRNNIPNSCYAHIAPAEGTSITYATFTLTFGNGSVITESGTQNLSNPIEWYSPTFTDSVSGMNDSVSCAVVSEDDNYTTVTGSIWQPVGYSFGGACDNASSCNLTTGATTSGNYYYDDIEMPSSQTLTMSGNTALYAKRINLLGTVTCSPGTGVTCPSMVYSAYNITTYAQTLNGGIANSVCSTNPTAPAGGGGGSITYENFTNVQILGPIQQEGQSGYSCPNQESCTQPSWGGDGGSAGILTFGDGIECGGTVYSNSSIILASGTGGTGSPDNTAYNPSGCHGGPGAYSGSLGALVVNCEDFINNGSILFNGSRGGAGGFSYNNIAGNGGPGLSGSFALENGAQFQDYGTVTIITNGGGNAGVCGSNSALDTGGNGGLAQGFGFTFNSSVINVTQPFKVTYATAGNGSQGTVCTYTNPGGAAYCANGAQLATVNLSSHGPMCINSTVNYTLPGATSGGAGSLCTAGSGWVYADNSTCSYNNYSELGPASTNGGNLSANPIPSFITINATGGYTPQNLLVNMTEDLNSSGIRVFITPPNYTYPVYDFIIIPGQNLSVPMTGWAPGNYTISAFSYNLGYGTPVSSTTINVSTVPTALVCTSTPSSLQNLPGISFSLNCTYSNQLDYDEVYYAGVPVTNVPAIWYLNQITDTPSSQYSRTNSLYYPTGFNFTQVVSGFRTDFNLQSVNITPLSFTNPIITLPYGVTAVKTLCLFPSEYDVRPVGENVKFGIFNVVNLNNASALNVTAYVTNVTPGITQWLTSNSIYTNTVAVLNTTPQRVLTNLPIFDGTQDVSDYSQQLWLYTNCTVVNVSSELVYPQGYTWGIG
jgi:hypothetical protein